MTEVLHVISGLKVGGAETALLRLIVTSAGSEYAHSVVALTPEGEMRQRFLAAGVELLALDFRRSPISSFTRLVKLIRARRPDIVQTWMYHADLFGGLAARFAGNRNIIWGIRTTDVSAGRNRATLLMQEMCARLSRLIPRTIVCVAEAALQRHAEVGYDRARMVVIPNGFDLDTLTATVEQRSILRSQCGFKPADIVVGTLGRFNPAKDFKNFVTAAALLARKFDNVRFLMVGRGLDKDNTELAKWIAESGCPDRFFLLGERTDVPACLAAMDVFCLSSRTEGFPNVVGEAMGMGLPCVATDVGDAAVLVGDTGIVVPKEDSHALASAVGGFIELSSSERHSAGQRGQQRVRDCFSLHSARAKFESVYRQLLTRN
jgi:glycosyltransferase involved in cell wall biosynthesis